jgi:hypothetical protein
LHLQSQVSRASAQIITTCMTSDVCYGLNIPAGTASSSSGDIFFQISAPSTYQWAALGQGSGMTGANMFVVYTSANGKNVTLSPRLGTGHSEPQFNSKAEVSLLDGSGVSNGKMIANIKCNSNQLVSRVLQLIRTQAQIVKAGPVEPWISPHLLGNGYMRFNPQVER